MQSWSACFDGDADRCMFLDENRKYIGSDMITGAAWQRISWARARTKARRVVYDLRSSHVVARDDHHCRRCAASATA